MLCHEKNFPGLETVPTSSRVHPETQALLILSAIDWRVSLKLIGMYWCLFWEFVSLTTVEFISMFPFSMYLTLYLLLLKFTAAVSASSDSDISVLVKVSMHGLLSKVHASKKGGSVLTT